MRLQRRSRHAVATGQRAKAEMDAKTGKILVDRRKQYDAARSNVNRIAAPEKAVESANRLSAEELSRMSSYFR